MMKGLRFTLMATMAVLLFTALQTRADVSCTQPGGYVKVQIDGRSENIVTAPMRKRGLFTGNIVAAGSNSLSFDAPGWTENQFSATASGHPQYYLEIVSGDLEGICFSISSNTTDTVVLDTGGAVLTGTFADLGGINPQTYVTSTGTDGTVSQTLQNAGDLARIRPVWTIAEVFGSGSTVALESFQDNGVANPSNGGGDRLLLPVNQFSSPAAVVGKELVHITGTGWRGISDASSDEGDNVLLPGQAVVVGRNVGSGVKLFSIGYPKVDRSVICVPQKTDDNPELAYLASPFSEELTLQELALSSTNATNSVVGNSSSLYERGDEFLVFDGNHGGPVPIATHRFIVLASGNGTEWRELGNATTTGTDLVLKPGKGFGILKRSTGSGGYWISSPSYTK